MNRRQLGHVDYRARLSEEALLESSNRLMLVASVVVGAAISAVLFLLAEYLYGIVAGCVMTAALVVVIGLLWYVMPWRRRHDRSGGDIER